jgi:hypothetical protein
MWRWNLFSFCSLYAFSENIVIIVQSLSFRILLTSGHTGHCEVSFTILHFGLMILMVGCVCVKAYCGHSLWCISYDLLWKIKKFLPVHHISHKAQWFFFQISLSQLGKVYNAAITKKNTIMLPFPENWQYKMSNKNIVIVLNTITWNTAMMAFFHTTFSLLNLCISSTKAKIQNEILGCWTTVVYPDYK